MQNHRNVFGHADLALDTDTLDNVGSAFDVTNHHMIGLQVVAETGAHATHVIRIQESLDGTTWFDSPTPTEITGVGAIFNFESNAHSVRAKVTTAEGAASTVDLRWLAKS